MIRAAWESRLAQLQRLPGLTQRDSDPGARSFVDEDMLAALQGGAFAKTVLGHFQPQDTDAVAALSQKAITMAAYILQRSGSTPQTVISVMERVSTAGPSNSLDSQFIADAFALANEMAQVNEVNALDFRGLVVTGAVVGKINLEDVEVRNVELRTCVIEEVVLGKGYENWRLRFVDSIISRISGAADASVLPGSVFDQSCEVESFDDMGTNNAVLNAKFPPELKALITVLRKLYKQAGAGRKVAALSRGIGQQEVSSCIDPVLSILQREGMVTIFNKVVHPVRKHASRVETILLAPSLSDDPVVKAVLQI